MVAVSYHDTVNDLQAFTPLSTPAQGPFGRIEWFTLLESKGGKLPHIVTAQQDSEFVTLPLMREGAALVPLANWYSFVWRPIGSLAANRDVFLKAIAHDLKRRECSVLLAPLPDEDDTARELQNAFRAGGWATFLERCDTNHTLPVGGCRYADYLKNRPGQLRTTLKRKAKHIDVEIMTLFQDNAWNTYESIYDKSWKPQEGCPAMLRAFAEQEGAAGRLRLGIATHQGNPVATQLWTVENGTAYIHKLAHIGSAKRLGAGTVLTAALMEHVIDRDGVSLVDFGTGDDGYKRDWMEAERPRWRLICLNRRSPRAWPMLLKACLSRLASGKSGG